MGKESTKAYKDPEFLGSRDARTIRILSEYLEPEARFRRLNVKDTIVFYGSARVTDGKTARKRYDYGKNGWNRSLLKNIVMNCNRLRSV